MTDVTLGASGHCVEIARQELEAPPNQLKAYWTQPMARITRLRVIQHKVLHISEDKDIKHQRNTAAPDNNIH